jgi:oxygen-independent coproporphyrinogen-3 oxidase
MTFGINFARDVSLYFHIPFCSKKCPYCHFFVLPDEEHLKAPFIPALLNEWNLRLPQLAGKRIVSIYFGGGTPTKLSPNAYQTLLQQITHSVELAPDCEITLEANPEDVTLELMSAFHSLGINRVSLGIQSLNNEELTQLGRTHNTNRSLQAIQAIHNAGLTNLSIDLMFELPAQTLVSWDRTLKALSSLPITHLSLYNLTFEPQTIFFKKRHQLLPQLPSDEDRLQMLQIAVQALESMGLKRYEISAFAKPNRQSRHNTGYWTGRPFLGFGPSAFSYWQGKRFANVAHFNRYLAQLERGEFPVDFEEYLEYPRNIQELFAINLRLLEGVDLNAFTLAQGPLPAVLEQAIERLIKMDWLRQTGKQIQLTSLGQLFYDSVAAELI